jgi:nuclear receptor subfamily 4 group A member 2
LIEQQQDQHNLETFPDLFSPSPSEDPSNPPQSVGESTAPADLYLDQQDQHSNSSSDTLVDTRAESIGETLLSSFKEETFTKLPEELPSTSTTPGDKDDLLFDTSSNEELGYLSYRSSSDPSLASTSRQPILPQARSSTTAPTLPEASSTLPSFQETYPIKYSQLANFGLKMDEDCFNMGSSQLQQGGTAAAYHTTHHQNLHHSQYDFQQHGQVHYGSGGGVFYTPSYEPHSMVSSIVVFNSYLG